MEGLAKILCTLLFFGVFVHALAFADDGLGEAQPALEPGATPVPTPAPGYLPDLTVGASVLPGSVPPNVPFTVTVTTYNAGDGAYLGGATTLIREGTGEGFLGLPYSQVIPSLLPHMSYSFSFNLTCSQTGTFYFEVIADAYGVRAETAENNNLQSFRITCEDPNYYRVAGYWLPQKTLFLDSGTVISSDMAYVLSFGNRFSFSSPDQSSPAFYVDFSQGARSGHLYAYRETSGAYHDYGLAPVNYMFPDGSVDTLTVTGQYGVHLGGMAEVTGNLVTLESKSPRAFRSVKWGKETGVLHLGLTGTAANMRFYEERTGTGIPLNEWPEVAPRVIYYG